MAESTGVELSVGSGAIDLLQAIADPVRWSVLATLADGPRCVCRLQEQIPIPSNLLSYHLKVLRDCDLVVATRRGRWVDYALAADAPDRMRDALPGAGSAVAR